MTPTVRFCLIVVAIVATSLALNGCGGSGQSAGGKPQGQPVVNWKPPPPESDAADKQAAADLLRVFLDPCQGKFPDDAAVALYAKDKGLTAMSADEVAELLGKDPGVGWVQHDESGAYVLTVEAPPYHACAVRVTFAHKPLALRSYLALELGMAVAGSGTGDRLEERPPVSFEQEGLSVTANIFVHVDAAGKTIEQYYIFIAARPDGAYPTRVVRQLATK
jgi:hypothetical protein